MKYFLSAAVVLGLLQLGAPAFAQSGQGGYTGKNPAANAQPSTGTAAQGSGQGGYLGKDAGKDQASGSAKTEHTGSGHGGPQGSTDHKGGSGYSTTPHGTTR